MKLLTFVFVIALSVSVFGQTPVGPKKKPAEKVDYKEVKVIPFVIPEEYSAGKVTANIKDGTRLRSLDWAQNSSVACFPGTRFNFFSGNHMLYRVALPAQSKMTITLMPKDGAQINLYAMRQSTSPSLQQVPPNVSSVGSCEASYPIVANLPSGRQVKNKRGDIKVEFMSIRNPYSILIGVAGAEGVHEGEFDLQVEVNSR